MNSVKQRNPGNPNERNRVLSPFAHRALRSTSSPLGWGSDLDGQVHEEPKARKGRNECDLGQKKHRKTLGEKGIKREMHVNRWLLSRVVQPCPVPDHCSLSQLLVKLHLYLISRVRGTSALCDCAWQHTLQQPQCCHESRGCLGCSKQRPEPTRAAGTRVSASPLANTTPEKPASGTGAKTWSSHGSGPDTGETRRSEIGLLEGPEHLGTGHC